MVPDERMRAVGGEMVTKFRISWVKALGGGVDGTGTSVERRLCRSLRETSNVSGRKVRLGMMEASPSTMVAFNKATVGCASVCNTDCKLSMTELNASEEIAVIVGGCDLEVLQVWENQSSKEMRASGTSPSRHCG